MRKAIAVTVVLILVIVAGVALVVTPCGSRVVSASSQVVVVRDTIDMQGADLIFDFRDNAPNSDGIITTLYLPSGYTPSATVNQDQIVQAPTKMQSVTNTMWGLNFSRDFMQYVTIDSFVTVSISIDGENHDYTIPFWSGFVCGCELVEIHIFAGLPYDMFVMSRFGVVVNDIVVNSVILNIPSDTLQPQIAMIDFRIYNWAGRYLFALDFWGDTNRQDWLETRQISCHAILPTPSYDTRNYHPRITTGSYNGQYNFIRFHHGHRNIRGNFYQLLLPSTLQKIEIDFHGLAFTEYMPVEITVRFYTLSQVHFYYESAASRSRSIIGILKVTAIVVGAIAIIAGGVVLYNAYLAAVPPPNLNTHSVNAVVRLTKTIDVCPTSLSRADFGRYIPLGLYDRPAYDNIPGWQLNGWIFNDRTGIWEADYTIPYITVRYYSKNNVRVATRQLAPILAPVSALQSETSTFRQRFWNGMRRILNLDFGGLEQDRYDSFMFNQMVTGLNNAHVVGHSEIWFVLARPDLYMPEHFGLFGSSGVTVDSTLFGFASGSPNNFNYLMFANFSGLNAWYANWEMVVVFDTPFDRGLAVAFNVWRAIQNALTWFVNGGWVWVLIIFVVLIAIVPITKGTIAIVYLFFIPFTSAKRRHKRRLKK